jgi:hypothetical protein
MLNVVLVLMREEMKTLLFGPVIAQKSIVKMYRKLKHMRAG